MDGAERAIIIIDLLAAIKNDDLETTKRLTQAINEDSTMIAIEDKNLSTVIFSPGTIKPITNSYMYLLENLQGLTDRENLIWIAKILQIKQSKNPAFITDFLQQYIDNPNRLKSLSYNNISDLIALAVDTKNWELLNQLRNKLGEISNEINV